MVKKKSTTCRRRKKSNTTTNKGAKRSKTEEEKNNPAEYMDGILQGIRAILGKMDEKDLLAVMMCVGSMEGAGGETENKVDDESAVDTKKFAATVANGRKQRLFTGSSMQKLLEFEGTTGKKSNRKYQKRENSRAIQRMHYWVRGGTEKLNESKCKPAKLPKGEKIRDHYHIYCCPELGLGRGVALRKIPCKCIACNNQMKKKWIHKDHPKEQPRVQFAKVCKYSKVLGDSNKWLIVELEQRDPSDMNYFSYQKEEGNLLKLQIRNHITLKVANDIEEGYIGGAVVTSDKDADGGYYLIKWTGTPYTDQESGELVCPGDYLMPVGRAPKWYTPGEDSDVVLVKHIIVGKVKMEEFSETNPIPRSANRKQAESMGALKISTDSDDFIFDEIHRRDRLEDVKSLKMK
eukprot:CAMPEP_0201277884 /NCGR_PEP_ID=MMETSP0853-20130426/59814_1 /ASSEMBLY_ACC=CAM_ASM_000640 /TAXON_ID=183588 /ORGANISM="Pseudo-nitzschia fraudulenta, Strain WWA7" /LENGTH=404 /DNA_ID=CAMNT_0047586119 /DNA_START=136 /DNA_END=1350 /DNA_ORIENTATION=-